MKCPSCGKRINEDSVFCSYCGAAIKDDISTHIQIIRNSKEAERQIRQEAADAMWAEVETPNKRETAPPLTKNEYSKEQTKVSSLIWSRTEKVKIKLICPECHSNYYVITPKGYHLSIKSNCPNCKRIWKFRYWNRIIGFIIFLIILYAFTLFLVFNAIGLF